jgi:hypothetical protein
MFARLLLLSLVFVLSACEEEVDQGPSFNRVNVKKNLAMTQYAKGADLIAEYYAYWQIQADGERVCGLFARNAIKGNSFFSCWGEDIQGGDYLKDNVSGTQRMVSVGDEHACVRFTNLGGKHPGNKIGCDGNNEFGQAQEPVTWAEPQGKGFWTVNPVMVVSGANHNCLLDDYGVFCWGDNRAGQLDAPLLVNPVMVAAGGDNSCAVTLAGTVKCWGANDKGQTEVPVELTADARNPVAAATQITMGHDFACALNHGAVSCWGNGDEGQLNVPALNNPQYVTAGYDHACALDDNGIQCWGSNNEGQSLVPAELVPSALVDGSLMSVTAGHHFTCATYSYKGYDFPLDADKFASAQADKSYQGVRCWGENRSDVLAVPAMICAGFHTSDVDPAKRSCE